MAHFKIELLTHVTDRKGANFNTYYLTSPITNFIAQTEDSQHFTTILSSDEKFTLHTNSQKDLTFSMKDKIFYNNEWIDNPYAHNIHIGSQLLLTDKFEHEYLMTVSKIDFQIEELNITYKVSCQDSFSYQAINQNQGYFIDNDPTSPNFLGAKTLDEWSDKIIKECYHTYSLLKTNQGLYIDNNNQLLTFSTEDKLFDVKQIIKPIYNEDYFQQLFTFSCSGSNAVAALISLGERLDCTIHTYEKSYRENGILKFNKFLWFEPKRNSLPTGLRYTPNIDLQSFNFSLNGNNLATVLNITPNHIGEEIISIFPTVPSFFQTWFQNAEDWDKTIYQTNLFTKKLLGTINEFHSNTTTKTETLSINLGTESEPNFKKYTVCKLGTNQTIHLSELYPYIDFNKQDNFSIINNTSSTSTSFKLLLPYEKENTSNKKELTYYIVEDHQEIPQWWYNEGSKDKSIYAAIDYDEQDESKDFYILLNTTRLADEEELAFAKIADKCPWLESKLINLQYALTQKIISKDEYQDIYNFLNNDMRIINGKLMAYAQSYYLELHKQTRTITKYTTIVDSIGAIMNHLMLNYAEKGSVDEKILTNFDLEYSKLFKANLSIDEDPTTLIDYNNIISDYFNKTFDANQKFFRYIKQFRDYFNSYKNFTSNNNTNELTQYSILANYTNTDTHYYSFQSNEFESIYHFNKNNKIELRFSSLKNIDIYNYQNDEYNKIILADNNIKNTYKHKEAKLIPITDKIYNENNIYFLTEANYISLIGEIPSGRYTFIQEDIKYVELTIDEIRLLILQKSSLSTPKYYTRKTNWYVPLDWVRYSYKNAENKVDWGSFKALKATNVMKIPVSNFIFETVVKEVITKEGLDTIRDRFYESYISSFPLDYIYYYGPKYTAKIQKTEDSEKYIVTRFNEYGYDQGKWDKLVNKYYIDHPEENKDKDNITSDIMQKYGSEPSQANLFQQVAFVSNIPAPGSTLNGLNLDNYLSNINNLEDALIYYSACKNQGYQKINLDSNINKFFSGSWGISILGTAMIYSLYVNSRYNADWLTHKDPEWLFEPQISYISDDKCTFSPSYKDYDSEIYCDSQKAIFGKTADAFSTMEKNTLIGLLDKNSPIKFNTDTKNLDNNKFFFNYYSLIAATYSFEYQSPIIQNDKEENIVKTAYTDDKPNVNNYHLWIKNHSYSRIMNWNDQIYKYDKYYIVLLDTEGTNSASKWTIFKDGNTPVFNPWDSTLKSKKYSNLQFYWLPKILLDLSNIPEKEWKNNLFPVQKLGYSQYIDSENISLLAKDGLLEDCIFQKTVSDTTWTFLLVHDEPYETQIIDGQKPTAYSNWDNYILNYKDWKGEKIYNIKTHAPVELLKESLPIDLLYTYKTYNTIEESYTLITDKDLEDSNISLYCKNDITGSYSRIYSERQIQENIDAHNNDNTSLLPLYFKNNQQYVKEYLDKDRTKFLVNLYSHNIKYDDTGKIVQHIKTPLYNQELDFTKAKYDSKTQQYIITFKSMEQDPYETDFILKKTVETSFKKLSNGEIWYQYHNTKISPSLVEQSNIIEVQLNKAWDAAVAASKMSNYFLPDSWKPSENEQPNSWADQLWQFSSSGHIHLSENILPKVSIYKAKYKDQYTEILPKYRFVYKQSQEENKTNVKVTDNFFTNNPTFKAHMALNGYRDETWTKWLLEDNGTCTYYYLQNTSEGILWKNVLSETVLASTNKRSKSLYDNFDGWYPMMYQIFRTRFSQLETLEYLELQKIKNEKWVSLYKAYPNIFLEKSYTNKDATTSQELLEMAELAFKDQQKPEEAYNLTVIDIAAIKGYNGQELNIGDSIQLDTEPLYSNFDDIYNSLNKFLFITDISYDLRKDTDIQLTVNTIKYQEKLLQQLVKLIR